MIKVINPKTGQVMLEEYDDGTQRIVSEELRTKESKAGEDSGYTPSPAELSELIAQIEAEEEDDGAVEGVVPYSSGPLDKRDSWDASAARARIARWASSDGSGDKDKVNWGKYKKAFLIVDGDPENFGSYKYPHHDVKDGTLYVVWGGVRSAMSFLMKTNPQGKRAAYNHLARHYKAFGKEVPPYKEDAYTDDEWRKWEESHD